jgi:hypothetical protein
MEELRASMQQAREELQQADLTVCVALQLRSISRRSELHQAQFIQTDVSTDGYEHLRPCIEPNVLRMHLAPGRFPDRQKWHVGLGTFTEPLQNAWER